MFIPSSSPDLNPIENAFAKLTDLLLKAATLFIAQPWKAIAQIIQTYSKANAQTTSPPQEIMQTDRKMLYP